MAYQVLSSALPVPHQMLQVVTTDFTDTQALNPSLTQTSSQAAANAAPTGSRKLAAI
jgi:hypothetical protein